MIALPDHRFTLSAVKHALPKQALIGSKLIRPADASVIQKIATQLPAAFYRSSYRPFAAIFATLFYRRSSGEMIGCYP